MTDGGLKFSEIPRLIIHREAPFAAIEYPDLFCLWIEGAARASTEADKQSMLSAGVTMARHAMERTRPSAELQSAYRKLFNSRWHQEISIGYSYTGAMHCVQKPIALVDDCAARSPANIKFRKRHARNREVVFVDEQSRRQAKMDIEVSSAARAADFGVYHPDYNYFFTLQSFFGVPGNASLRFTDEARTSRAIMAIFSFASALLPLILRSKMDLNIPAART